MLDGIVAIAYAKRLFKGVASGLDHAEDIGNNTIRFHWTNGTTTDIVLTNSSGGTTTEEIVSNVACGGVTSGTTIPINTDLTTLAKMLLVKYLAPVISIVKPSTTLYKVGTRLTINSIDVNVTKKSKDITSVKLYKNDTLIEEKTEGITNGGNISFDISQTLAETTTFKVVASDGTSSGQDTLTYKFVNPIYTGYEKAGFTEILQDKGTIVFNATCTLDKPQIKYPKSWGNPKSFTDMNGFSMMNSFTVTEKTINGVDYYVYTNNSITTVTNFKYTMEF